MIDKDIAVTIGNSDYIWRRVKLSQYDTDWRFNFTVYDGNEVYNIPVGSVAVLNGKKKDGTVFAYSGSIQNNVVTVVCGKQVSSAAGEVECELRLSTTGGIVSSANFIFDVEASPISGFVLSENDFSALDQLINDAISAIPDYVHEHLSDEAAVEAMEATEAAVATVQANAAIVADETAAIDEKVNRIHGFLNYGYNLAADIAENPAVTNVNSLGVKRIKTDVTLNRSNAEGSTVYIKLTGDVARVSSQSATTAWTDTFVPVSGHKYRITSRLVSGTLTLPEGVGAPQLRLHKQGAYSQQATHISNVGTDRVYEYTSDGSAVLLIFQVNGKTTAANARYQILMQDLTDNKLAELEDALAEEGDAWED